MKFVSIVSIGELYFTTIVYLVLLRTGDSRCSKDVNTSKRDILAQCVRMDSRLVNNQQGCMVLFSTMWEDGWLFTQQCAKVDSKEK